jgi:plastocyanin
VNVKQLKQGLTALLFALLLGAASAGTPDVTVTLQHVDVVAWTVTAVEGAEGVAKLDVENTPITLTVGQRYRFINLGTVRVHPLALRGEDGEPLINQRPQDRPFETDPAVDFRADDAGITFTLTEELAAQLSTYYCTAHPAPLMEGPLEVRTGL